LEPAHRLGEGGRPLIQGKGGQPFQLRAGFDGGGFVAHCHASSAVFGPVAPVPAGLARARVGRGVIALGRGVAALGRGRAGRGASRRSIFGRSAILRTASSVLRSGASTTFEAFRRVPRTMSFFGGLSPMSSPVSVTSSQCRSICSLE